MIPNPKTRIMVFGTFDILHKGHLNFFKQARRLARNPYLIVSVARDANVKKIKGRLPDNNEQLRFALIKPSRLVDKVVLGGKVDYLQHIKSQKPKIIALGYDQKAYVQGLSQKLAKLGLNVQVFRLKPFKPGSYKSSLFKKKPKA